MPINATLLSVTNKEKTGMKKDNEYLTISQISKKFPAFSEPSLRWHRYKNTADFNKCVRRVGRKILISTNDFIHWLEVQAQKEE